MNEEAEVRRSEFRKVIHVTCLLALFAGLCLNSCGTQKISKGTGSQVTPSSSVVPRATASPTKPPAPPVQGTLPGWHLIFDDEFNGAAVNTNLWHVADSGVAGSASCCTGIGNETWSGNDVTVSNGALHITTQATPDASHPYASGALTTENSLTFKYGRVDIRAKLPSTRGLWPAFWLVDFPNSAGYYDPYYEVDFLEAWMGDPNDVFAYIHWNHSQVTCTASSSTFTDSFHVYTIIWSPGHLTWQIDGKTKCEDATYVPDVPMYLILDVAIDGFIERTDSSTVLPQTTEVDYVRVWQR